MQEILDNPEDKTKISLVYANVSEKDILLKDELDELSKKHHGKLNIHYGQSRHLNVIHKLMVLLAVLDKAPEDWKGSKGFIDEAVLNKYLVRIICAVNASPLTQPASIVPRRKHRYFCLWTARHDGAHQRKQEQGHDAG